MKQRPTGMPAGWRQPTSSDHEAARKCFARAVQLDPDSPALRVNLGVTLVKLRRTTEAIREFRTALTRAPDNVSALNNLGSVYLDLGKPRDALPLLERAARLAPADVDLRTKLMSAAISEAGDLLSQGESRKAIDLLLARGNTALENKYARWILGSAYEQLQQYTVAFEHFAAAVDLDPADRRAVSASGLAGPQGKDASNEPEGF